MASPSHASPGEDWHFPVAKRLTREDQWLEWNRVLASHLERVKLDRVFMPGRTPPFNWDATTEADIRRAANIIYWGCTKKPRERVLGPSLDRNIHPFELWEKLREWCRGSTSPLPPPVGRPPDPASVAFSAPASLADYQSALVSITSSRLHDCRNLAHYTIDFNSHRKKLMAWGCGLTDRDYILLYIKGVGDAPKHRTWIDRALQDLEREPRTTLHHVQFISGALPQKPTGLGQRAQKPPEVDRRSTDVTVQKSPELSERSPKKREGEMRDTRDDGGIADSRGRVRTDSQERARPHSHEREPASASHAQGTKDVYPRRRDNRKPGDCNHRNHRPEECFIDHPELYWGPGKRPGLCRHSNHRPEDCYADHLELRLQGGQYDSYKPSEHGRSAYRSHSREGRRSYDGGDAHRTNGTEARDGVIKREPPRDDLIRREPPRDYLIKREPSIDAFIKREPPRTDNARGDSRGDREPAGRHIHGDHENKDKVPIETNSFLSPTVSRNNDLKANDKAINIKTIAPFAAPQMSGCALESMAAVSMLVEEVKASLVASPASAESRCEIPGLAGPETLGRRDSGNTGNARSLPVESHDGRDTRITEAPAVAAIPATTSSSAAADTNGDRTTNAKCVPPLRDGPGLLAIMASPSATGSDSKATYKAAESMATKESDEALSKVSSTPVANGITGAASRGAATGRTRPTQPTGPSLSSSGSDIPLKDQPQSATDKENRPPKRKLPEDSNDPQQPATTPAPKKRWSAADMLRAYAPSSQYF